MPWIHPGDLCNIYLKVLADESLSGAFNAVAPQHITQKEFMQHLSGVLGKRYFHPPVPAFFLRLVLGQMAGVVLYGSRISPEKIMSAGYTFKNPDLKETLARILT
jgi:NAD dependent epimerase/dehydratase family enzyme